MSARVIQLNNGRRTYSIITPEILFGRAANNDIIISDPRVSQRHARIIKKVKGFYLEDLGSSNGTFFQGRNIQSVHLRNNDIFRIGSNEFQFLEENVTILDSGASPTFDDRNIEISKRYSQHLPAENPGISPPAVGSRMWIPWVAGGGLTVIVIILVILFYPFYEVSTGTIVACKHCGKEVLNDVRHFNVSLLDKDNSKYRIERTVDYCASCGNEQVPYTVSYYCEFCGSNYKTENLYALRREEKQNENLTRGFCNGFCAGGKKVEDYGDKAMDLLNKVTNPFE